MDAFARIEPVARPLLLDVDLALATLGAPAEHPVWTFLRRLGATPADAVAFFADAEPDRMSDAGASLRQLVPAYGAAAVPTQLPWQGSAGERYAHHARALNEHLCGEHPDSMAARVATTASYVEELAAWHVTWRGSLAVALADVITSRQAVALAGGLASEAPSVVAAAADIGAYLLAIVAEAIDEGHDLNRRWRPLLADLHFRPPVDGGPTPLDATIRLAH